MPSPPIVMFSALTGRVFVVTRYHIEMPADPKGRPRVVARQKYDVTETADIAMVQRAKWLRAERRAIAGSPSAKRSDPHVLASPPEPQAKAAPRSGERPPDGTAEASA